MTEPTFSDLRHALTAGRPGPVPWWVTREVGAAGSELGAPVTGGPLEPDEVELSRSLGMGASRWAIVRHDLTPAAMEQLYAALAAGRYAVRYREEAAVLVVAWLLRKGKRQQALEVVTALSPVADEVRLGPRLGPAPVVPAGEVFRSTAGSVRERLARRQPSPSVLAQTEALTVWNPLTDQLVELWLEVLPDREQVALADVWRKRALGVVEDVEELAREHTRCGRVRRSTSGLAIMVRHLRWAAERGELTAAQWSTVRRVVDGTVARRGAPGSSEHRLRRSDELRTSATPPRVALAHLVAQRLSDHLDEEGVVDVETVLAPVTAEEAAITGIPEQARVPAGVRRVVARARTGRPEDLVASGVIPSARALGEVTPQLAARATAAGSDADPVLATLLSACWRAHERYTSTMSQGLRRQERFEELPWVKVLDWRPASPARERALAVVREVAGLALGCFPGTALPDSLVRALRQVLDDAGVRSVLLEEERDRHVRDGFPDGYRASASLAAQMLGAGVYGRYFDIHPDVIGRLRPDGVVPAVLTRHLPRLRSRRTFTALCHQRADLRAASRPSTEAVRAVREQAHILTADQVPALLHLGVQPSVGWDELARRSFDVVCDQVAHSLSVRPGSRAASRSHRRAQVAWRQVVLDLALAAEVTQADVMSGIREALDRQDRAVQAWITPNLRSLEHVLAGGSLSPGGR